MLQTGSANLQRE